MANVLLLSLGPAWLRYQVGMVILPHGPSAMWIKWEQWGKVPTPAWAGSRCRKYMLLAKLNT